MTSMRARGYDFLCLSLLNVNKEVKMSSQERTLQTNNRNNESNGR